MKSDIRLRIQNATAHQEQKAHPGPYPFPLAAQPQDQIIELFIQRFTQSGGEVNRFNTLDEAQSWSKHFLLHFTAIAVSRQLPKKLFPAMSLVPVETAELGISFAQLAVAETGSLILSSLEGRRMQLLPPVHLIWVYESCVVANLSLALSRLIEDPASVIAFHSGPSRSADIGQIMVQGVHGPGRVIIGLIAE